MQVNHRVVRGHREGAVVASEAIVFTAVARHGFGTGKIGAVEVLIRNERSAIDGYGCGIDASTLVGKWCISGAEAIE